MNLHDKSILTMEVNSVNNATPLFQTVSAAFLLEEIFFASSGSGRAE